MTDQVSVLRGKRKKKGETASSGVSENTLSEVIKLFNETIELFQKHPKTQQNQSLLAQLAVLNNIFPANYEKGLQQITVELATLKQWSEYVSNHATLFDVNTVGRWGASVVDLKNMADVLYACINASNNARVRRGIAYFSDIGKQFTKDYQASLSEERWFLENPTIIAGFMLFALLALLPFVTKVLSQHLEDSVSESLKL